MLAKIEWQIQPAKGPLVWREYSRTGKVRGSPEAGSEDYQQLFNTEERTLPEVRIAEVWDAADILVREEPKLWQAPQQWPGDGFEQLRIEFCHARLGWQTLSLNWPSGSLPNSGAARHLVELLKSNDAAAIPTVKETSNIQISAILSGKKLH